MTAVGWDSGLPPWHAPQRLGAETGHCSNHDRIRKYDDIPLSENNMVAPADDGMIPL
jgi:hypothetical protein